MITFIKIEPPLLVDYPENNSKLSAAEVLLSVGVAMIFIGIMIMILAVILTSARSGGSVKGGGAVIVGPIPIVFGTDKKSLGTVLVLSIVLTVLVFVFFIVQYLLLR